MEIYAKGQLSYLILNCLLERDFYGLDIISEVKERSNGHILLKKPSVYSNLTRMEKQGQVSSYVQSSELGPNRRYYSITEKGKATYTDLKDYFDRNGIDVFKDFSEDDTSPSFVVENKVEMQDFVQNTAVVAPKISPVVEQKKIEEVKPVSIFDENDDNDDEEEEDTSDFFDFSSLDDKQKSDKQELEPKQEEKFEEPTVQTVAMQVVIEDNVEEKSEEQTPIEEPENITEEAEEQVQVLLEVENQPPVSEKVEEAAQVEQKAVIHDEEIYDNGIFLTDEDVKKAQTPAQAPAPESDKKYSIASLLQNQNNQEEEESESVLETENAQTQLSNQQIYDISKDINKYKRKRSFAEDQMAFAYEEPVPQAQDKTKMHIEELKSSILANKGNQNERMTQEEFYGFRQKPVTEEIVKMATSSAEQKPESGNDGVFLNGISIDRSQALKPRKIEPPRLKIIGDKEPPLPAPRKDNSIDLSHKDIISRLYAKSKGGDEQDADDAFYDYDDLQDYYNTQGVSFRVYEKSNYLQKHNTNKLNFVASMICMILAIVLSAGLFTALYLTGHTMPATNFLYIVLPIFAVAFAVYKYIIFKHHTSWEPKPMLSQWWIILITLLGLGAIIGLNFIFGMKANMTFLEFSNTLFLPALFVLLFVPAHYYIKKALFVKYWR